MTQIAASRRDNGEAHHATRLALLAPEDAHRRVMLPGPRLTRGVVALTGVLALLAGGGLGANAVSSAPAPAASVPTASAAVASPLVAPAATPTQSAAAAAVVSGGS